MRFFLVRILGFTVLFTLLLLLLSWIAPTWTGNTVQSLTSWRPIQEHSVNQDDELIITDLSESGDEDTTAGDIGDENDVEDNISNPEEPDTIVVDKDEEYNTEDVIDVMDDVLNIDHTPSRENNTETDQSEPTTIHDYEPTPPAPTPEVDEEINHLPEHTTLSPDELEMLEQFEQSIR